MVIKELFMRPLHTAIFGVRVTEAEIDERIFTVPDGQVMREYDRQNRGTWVVRDVLDRNGKSINGSVYFVPDGKEERFKASSANAVKAKFFGPRRGWVRHH